MNLSPYSIMGETLLGISSHIHDHNMDANLQAYDLFEKAHLKLAHHLFFLHYVDILKVYMGYNFIFFMAYLS
jgi:hypothetical protein